MITIRLRMASYVSDTGKKDESGMSCALKVGVVGRVGLRGTLFSTAYALAQMRVCFLLSVDLF